MIIKLNTEPHRKYEWVSIWWIQCIRQYKIKWCCFIYWSFSSASLNCDWKTLYSDSCTDSSSRSSCWSCSAFALIPFAPNRAESKDARLHQLLIFVELATIRGSCAINPLHLKESDSSFKSPVSWIVSSWYLIHWAPPWSNCSLNHCKLTSPLALLP